jgi:hypothetical protein
LFLVCPIAKEIIKVVQYKSAVAENYLFLVCPIAKKIRSLLSTKLVVGALDRQQQHRVPGKENIFNWSRKKPTCSGRADSRRLT